MEYTEKCGCKVKVNNVWVSGKIIVSLTYCPLHKSAPDMYEALKVAYRELLHAQWEDGLDQIEEVLAKAEGK